MGGRRWSQTRARPGGDGGGGGGVVAVSFATLYALLTADLSGQADGTILQIEGVGPVGRVASGAIDTTLAHPLEAADFTPAQWGTWATEAGAPAITEEGYLSLPPGAAATLRFASAVEGLAGVEIVYAIAGADNDYYMDISILEAAADVRGFGVGVSTWRYGSIVVSDAGVISRATTQTADDVSVAGERNRVVALPTPTKATNVESVDLSTVLRCLDRAGRGEWTAQDTLAFQDWRTGTAVAYGLRVAMSASRDDAFTIHSIRGRML